MKVGLLCGGPSLERGISLNSARSVLDHLADKNIEIVPVYFDSRKKAYRISSAQLYSNTPSDFDFKLRTTAVPLTAGALVKLLKSLDIVFPVMHGPFGEDGGVQDLLEAHHIPFVGSSAEACRQAFDKYAANELIRGHGFYTLPSMVLDSRSQDHIKKIQDFFKKHKIKRAIVKPAIGGSSIGVFSVATPAAALKKANLIFSAGMSRRVVIEPFAKGIEFTTIILQNRFGLPVAVLPTEIETDYTEHQIFDFRKKYLPTRHVTYHCPPRFSNEVIERIQVQAQQIFGLLGMRDFARFDGWVLENGEIWFSDFNPVSGMEQNSFLFQQASRIGLSHRDVLRLVLQRACERHGLRMPSREEPSLGKRKPVHVLCGGPTSERQVSLMTGTNVWLKLRRSELYEPTLFILDLHNNVWELPYAYALNHTVEEIVENCVHARQSQARLDYLERKVALSLALRPGEITEPRSLPRKMSLKDFIKSSAFVFIALHGGEGENGVLQKKLAAGRVTFNGSGQKVSALCMDKWATGQEVSRLNIDGLSAVPGKVMPLAAAIRTPAPILWRKLCAELNTRTLIVKPRADGCSSGVVHLYNPNDLQKYLRFAERRITSIPGGTFTNQSGIVEMPSEKIRDILFERFVETDTILTSGGKLAYLKRSGWVEVTVGVVGAKNKKMKAMNPSLTVSEGEVLSVEEKFQGGTGINITPPPGIIVRPKALARAKELIRKLAEGVGIAGYARIDAFLEVGTGNIQVIEINNLPALTPSTVFYHQGLAENPPIYPREILEKLVANKGY